MPIKNNKLPINKLNNQVCQLAKVSTYIFTMVQLNDYQRTCISGSKTNIPMK